MRCGRCGLPHIRLSLGTCAGEPLRWLSIGMRRSTRACDACAPRRDSCGRSMHHERPLHQQDASHSVQDRAATCLLRPPTHSRTFTWQTRGRVTTTLAVSREEAQHARLRRACGAPHWFRSLCVSRKVTALAGGLFHSLQGRGAMCQVRSPAQPAFAWQMRGRATALAISWIEPQHARLRRARGAPRWFWSLHTSRY